MGLVNFGGLQGGRVQFKPGLWAAAVQAEVLAGDGRMGGVHTGVVGEGHPAVTGVAHGPERWCVDNLQAFFPAAGSPAGRRGCHFHFGFGQGAIQPYPHHIAAQTEVLNHFFFYRCKYGIGHPIPPDGFGLDTGLLPKPVNEGRLALLRHCPKGEHNRPGPLRCCGTGGVKVPLTLLIVRLCSQDNIHRLPGLWGLSHPFGQLF